MGTSIDALLGLGDQSFRKSYYPELRKTIDDLARERDKFRAIYDNSVQLIGLLDADGYLLDANQTALAMAGVKAEDVCGQHFADTPWWKDDPESRERLRNALVLARQGKACCFEATHRVDADGAMRQIQVCLTPIADADGVVRLIIPEGRDISSLKDQEQAIRLQNLELERRVSERTASLEQTVRQLQETRSRLVDSEKNAALARMVSAIAHEVNTPIGIATTGISGLNNELASLVEQYRGHTLTEADFFDVLDRLSRLTGMVEQSLRRAADLVNSFKMVSVDQFSEQRRHFVLDSYLEELGRSLRVLLKPAHHELGLDCPRGLACDSYPGALAQIVTNLVNNSLIHGFKGRSGGFIQLRVVMDDGLPVLLYQDDGLGIGDSVREHLFEPFYTTNREAGSSGLGMSIVANLVQRAFGGSIEVLPGPGAQFRMTLPGLIKAPGS